MIWLIVLLGLAGLALYLGSLFMRGEIRRLVRALRWGTGGLMLAIAAFLGVRGQMMIASLLAAGGVGVIARGRLGPIDFGAGQSRPDNASSVKSDYLAMALDHDTGSVSGEVRAGQFAGRNLADLSADECWALYEEVADNPDSLALFQSWLDANREGWRDYFSEQFGMDEEEGEDAGNGKSRPLSSLQEAYEILGLSPGASAEQIRASHRTLMKKVHPDAGGSSFLAAKINEAKDLLLKDADQRA